MGKLSRNIKSWFGIKDETEKAEIEARSKRVEKVMDEMAENLQETLQNEGFEYYFLLGFGVKPDEEEDERGRDV